jgi:integrase
LNDDEEFNNLNFLKKVDKVTKFLEDYKPNTQKIYLISIVSVLSLYKSERGYKTLYKKYYDLMMNLRNELKEIPTNQMSEQQKNNWMDWEEVMKIYEEVKGKVPIKIKNERDYQKLLDYVILSLYVLNEPRRNMDYLKMGIIKNIPEVYEVVGGQDNYLNLDKDEFIFNNFKNFKSQGRQTIKFNDDFKQVINLYIKNRKDINPKQKKYFAYLLVDYEGHRIDKGNYITNVLNRLFKKKVGSSLLRHIYITFKFGKVNEEQEKTAYNMGHTQSTQREYIKTKE